MPMDYDTTYIPPATLDDMDEDIIHQRMMDDLPIDIDKAEGGMAYDFTRPAAVEKAAMMVVLNDAMQAFFPEWSWENWLDQIALTMQITRRPAGFSSGYLTVTGDEGRSIPTGFLFATPSEDGEENTMFEAVNDYTIDETGVVLVYARCTEAGPVGNVPARTVTMMVEPITGISSVTNDEVMSGGTDPESDDSLRERIMGKDRNLETSFVGNPNDYRRWAMEVVGVGAVVVVPEPDGPGSGSVKLIVMDGNGLSANQAIMDAVYDHIMSPDDEEARLAPIGAKLTVETATMYVLNVTATVTLDAVMTIDSVKALFHDAFERYMEEAYTDGVIRNTRVGSILSRTPGVVDYHSLLINGSADNLDVSQGAFPAIGSIILAVSVT